MFELDTGAEVTVNSEVAWTKLGSVKLTKPLKGLCGADQKPSQIYCVPVYFLLQETVVYTDSLCGQASHNLLGSSN